jgi:CBS domain-containing protein/ribosome-associated translation inhibitor RaiA
MSVRTFLEKPKVVAHPMDKVSEVLGKMRETNYWAVPVVQDNKLVGMLDYKSLMAKKFTPETKVLTLMSPAPKLNEDSDERSVIAMFYNTRARVIPVVNGRGSLVGVVTRETVLRHYLDRGEIPSRPVREFMNSPVLTINGEDTVARAKFIMRSYNVSKLPVLERDQLAGIITMRDIALRVLFSYKGKKRSSIMTEEEKLLATPVKEIMSYPVITATGSNDLTEAVNVMLKRNVSGLPVIEGGRVVGMISGIDVITKVIAKKFELSSPISAKLPRGLDENQKALIDGLLDRYLSKFERIVEVIDFKYSVKEEASSEGRPLYKVNIRLVTKIGDFVSTESDYDIVTATRKAADDVEERLLRKLKKIEDIKKTRGDLAKAAE